MTNDPTISDKRVQETLRLNPNYLAELPALTPYEHSIAETFRRNAHTPPGGRSVPNGYISLIKTYKQRTGRGLAESKDAIDYYWLVGKNGLDVILDLLP